MSFTCVDLVYQGRACTTQCRQCAGIQALVGVPPRPWWHHPGAAVAHQLAPDTRDAVCGATDPSPWPEPWRPAPDTLARCNTCQEAP